MSRLRTLVASAVISLLWVGPAHAAGSIPLPDPSGVTLFTLGVAGLLIGRRYAGKDKD